MRVPQSQVSAAIPRPRTRSDHNLGHARRGAASANCPPGHWPGCGHNGVSHNLGCTCCTVVGPPDRIQSAGSHVCRTPARIWSRWRRPQTGLRTQAGCHDPDRVPRRSNVQSCCPLSPIASTTHAMCAAPVQVLSNSPLPGGGHAQATRAVLQR